MLKTVSIFVFFLYPVVSLAQHASGATGPTYNFYFQNYPQNPPAPAESKAEKEVLNQTSNENSPNAVVPTEEKRPSELVRANLVDSIKQYKLLTSLNMEVETGLRKGKQLKQSGFGIGPEFKLGIFSLGLLLLAKNIEATFAPPVELNPVYYDGNYGHAHEYFEEYSGKVPGAKISLRANWLQISQRLSFFTGVWGSAVKGNLTHKTFSEEKAEFTYLAVQGQAGFDWQDGNLKARLAYGLGEGRNIFENTPMYQNVSSRVMGRTINYLSRQPTAFKKTERFTSDSLTLGLAYIF